MRRWLAIGLIVVAFVPVSAGASCAAPFIEVQSDVVKPGDQVRVTGDAFLDGCNDVGGGSVCGLIPQAPEPEPPMADVRLELHRGGEVVDAVEVDADSDGRLEGHLTVPEGAEAGRYAVDLQYHGTTQQRVRVRVEGSSQPPK